VYRGLPSSQVCGLWLLETLLSNTCKRYYAKAVLTSLHRSIAIPEWDALRNGNAISLANAVGAFDLFIPESRFGNFDEVGKVK
jgi:F-box protein 21